MQLRDNNADYNEKYMRLALQLAESALGQTGINPVVGCVIVQTGRIVGMGAHLERGKEHAEIHALNMAAGQAEGSTLYVTLEPCSHQGQTPPCVDRIIQERISKVVVAMLDPNPAVSGNGVRILREHGIEVEVGVLQDEANRLNEAFIKYMTTQMPFVTMKAAATLDGKLASRTGDSKWITGEAARHHVHILRHRHQAIMVGVDTVIADNPQLTTRLQGGGIHPIRIIADSRLRIPLDSVLLHDGQAPVIILTTDHAPSHQRKQLEALGADIIACGSGEHVDLLKALISLGQREILSILLEGGSTLNGAMLEAQTIDKIVLFIAPKLIGGMSNGIAPFTGFEKMADAITLKKMTVKTFADDLCIEGYPVYKQTGGV